MEMEERRQARLLEERKLEQERLLKERKMEWKESPANKLKLWGDALRNAISRMPVEPVDIVSWFQFLEKLFEQLKVPVELYAVLMRPYLSDKAKFLLSRVDLEESTDYGAVKRYILQEMQLTPSVYLDKFQAISRTVLKHTTNLVISCHRCLCIRSKVVRWVVTTN